MKTKILLLASACLLNCAIVFGQRQQTTEDYNPSPAGFPTTGKKTYSYIIGEDGKKLKDGSFSISAKPDILVVDKGFSRYAVSNNGYFKLNTTFMKGNLHGVLTSSFSITVTKQGLAGNASESYKMTFSGNFSDGLPHGTFNIKYDTDSNDKLVATYNNGVLVGAYSSSGIYKKLPCIVKGTLTPKGELTGKWTIEDLKSHIYEFQNGVLIRETSEEEATRPAITELAKKYATGAITEAELEKQNIIVLEDSIPLGSFARNIIFRDEVFDIQDVGGYDFSNPNNKRYKYLKEVSCFNEKGFEFYTQMLDEKLKAGVFTHYANIQKNQKHEYGEIGFVNGSHAIRDAYLNHCDPYINAKGLKEHDWKTDIYLTKEQVRIWGEKTTEAKKLHAQTFGFAGSNTDERCFGDNIKMYFKDTDRVFTFYEYERIRESAKHEVESGGISEVFNRFMLVPGESEYLVEKSEYLEGYTGREYDALLFTTIPFVKKESVGRDTTIIYLLAGEYEKLIKGKSKEETERIDAIKKELDEKYKKDVLSIVMPPVKNILDRLVNQSVMSIAYADDIDDYFSSVGLPEEYWNLEFQKKLKPFGKILGYEIVDFHGEEFEDVECILTCLGKKKAQNKYKVIWKLEKDVRGNIRIIANSIDINNATIIVDAAQQANAEAERIAKEEAERVAKEKAEAERIAKAEAEQLAKEKAEAERLEKEQAEAARLAKVEEERAAKAEAEAKRIAKVEAERAEKEKAKAKAKEKVEEVAANNIIVEEKPLRNAEKPLKAFEGRTIGYEQYLDLSGIAGSSFFAGINYIGGYRFNQRLFLGIGTGLDLSLEKNSALVYEGDYELSGNRLQSCYYSSYMKPSLINIPIYANLRTNFSKKRLSPYLSVSLGYRLSLPYETNLNIYSDNPVFPYQINASGALFAASFGMSKALSDGKSLYWGIGIAGQYQYIYDVSLRSYSGTDEPWVSENSEEWGGSVILNFGVSF